MISKLNREYNEWTKIGHLSGSVDFSESCQRFQDMFSAGEYYAMFDVISDTWFFTKEIFGKFRYPHYTVKYTGDGSQTTDEHFTYEQGKHIYPTTLPKRDTKDRFNEELDKIATKNPEVSYYYIY